MNASPAPPHYASRDRSAVISPPKGRLPPPHRRASPRNENTPRNETQRPPPKQRAVLPQETRPPQPPPKKKKARRVSSASSSDASFSSVAPYSFSMDITPPVAGATEEAGGTTMTTDESHSTNFLCATVPHHQPNATEGEKLFAVETGVWSMVKRAKDGERADGEGTAPTQKNTKLPTAATMPSSARVNLSFDSDELYTDRTRDAMTEQRDSMERHRLTQTGATWLILCTVVKYFQQINRQKQIAARKQTALSRLHPRLVLWGRRILRRARNRIASRTLERPSVTDIRHDRMLGLFSEAHIQYLVDNLKPRFYFPNETIIFMGCEDDECYVLSSGSADVLMGKVKVFTMTAGMVFGSVGMISGEPRTATIVAREPCYVWYIARKVFESYGARDHQVAAAQTIIRELRQKNIGSVYKGLIDAEYVQGKFAGMRGCSTEAVAYLLVKGEPRVLKHGEVLVAPPSQSEEGGSALMSAEEQAAREQGVGLESVYFVLRGKVRILRASDAPIPTDKVLEEHLNFLCDVPIAPIMTTKDGEPCRPMEAAARQYEWHVKQTRDVVDHHDYFASCSPGSISSTPTPSALLAGGGEQPNDSLLLDAHAQNPRNKYRRLWLCNGTPCTLVAEVSGPLLLNLSPVVLGEVSPFYAITCGGCDVIEMTSELFTRLGSGTKSTLAQNALNLHCPFMNVLSLVSLRRLLFQSNLSFDFLSRVDLAQLKQEPLVYFPGTVLTFDDPNSVFVIVEGMFAEEELDASTKFGAGGGVKFIVSAGLASVTSASWNAASSLRGGAGGGMERSTRLAIDFDASLAVDEADRYPLCETQLPPRIWPDVSHIFMGTQPQSRTCRTRCAVFRLRRSDIIAVVLNGLMTAERETLCSALLAEFTRRYAEKPDVDALQTFGLLTGMSTKTFHKWEQFLNVLKQRCRGMQLINKVSVPTATARKGDGLSDATTESIAFPLPSSFLGSTTNDYSPKASGAFDPLLQRATFGESAVGGGGDRQLSSACSSSPLRYSSPTNRSRMSPRNLQQPQQQQLGLSHSSLTTPSLFEVVVVTPQPPLERSMRGGGAQLNASVRGVMHRSTGQEFPTPPPVLYAEGTRNTAASASPLRGGGGGMNNSNSSGAFWGYGASSTTSGPAPPRTGTLHSNDEERMQLSSTTTLLETSAPNFTTVPLASFSSIPVSHSPPYDATAQASGSSSPPLLHEDEVNRSIAAPVSTSVLSRSAVQTTIAGGGWGHGGESFFVANSPAPPPPPPLPVAEAEQEFNSLFPVPPTEDRSNKKRSQSNRPHTAASSSQNLHPYHARYQLPVFGMMNASSSSGGGDGWCASTTRRAQHLHSDRALGSSSSVIKPPDPNHGWISITEARSGLLSTSDVAVRVAENGKKDPQGGISGAPRVPPPSAPPRSTPAAQPQQTTMLLRPGGASSVRTGRQNRTTSAHTPARMRHATKPVAPVTVIGSPLSSSMPCPRQRAGVPPSGSPPLRAPSVGVQAQSSSRNAATWLQSARGLSPSSRNGAQPRSSDGRQGFQRLHLQHSAPTVGEQARQVPHNAIKEMIESLYA